MSNVATTFDVCHCLQHSTMSGSRSYFVYLQGPALSSHINLGMYVLDPCLLRITPWVQHKTQRCATQNDIEIGLSIVVNGKENKAQTTVA
jgi:hypothetical protein